MLPNEKETKVKITTGYTINAFAQKRNHQKRKRQPIEWDKIIANVVTDKRIILNIYKQLIQLNIKNK